MLTGLGNYDGTYRIPFTIYQPVNLATAATIDPIAPEFYTRTAPGTGGDRPGWEQAPDEGLGLFGGVQQ